MRQHKLAVKRERGLERNQRLPAYNPFCKWFGKAARFRFAQSGDDFDSRSTQMLEAAAGNGRIRILHGCDHALDACQNQRIGAWSRASLVATRLEVYVERRAACSVTLRYRAHMLSLRG